MKRYWYTLTEILAKFQVAFKRVLPNREDNPEARYLKIVILGAISMLLIVLVTALLTFLLVLQGGEQTVVPDLRGKELTNALILL
ncbi:MAG: hypothetical protein SNJ78_01925, partial [Spirochaetales bacterium]